MSILDHLQRWMFHFMDMHERLDIYNATWLSVPSYHDLTTKTKLYKKVSHWNGKKMNEMSRYQLGVITQSLRGGSSAQRPIFHHAIECTRALSEFDMNARYKCQDNTILSDMDDALHGCHTFKDVFLLG
jgi:hypothetical protein